MYVKSQKLVRKIKWHWFFFGLYLCVSLLANIYLLLFLYSLNAVKVNYLWYSLLSTSYLVNTKIYWNLCSFLWALHIALEMEKCEVNPLCTCVSLKRNKMQMNMYYTTFKFKWKREKNIQVSKNVDAKSCYTSFWKKT